MDPRPVVNKRFSDVQLDIVGPLSPSEGMRYLFTIVCRTTRWVEAIPIAKADAISCCKAFIDGWVQHFGIPATATSDNGSTFTSRLWTDIQRSLGTIVSYSPPYRPQAVGHIERSHRDIKVGLKANLLHMGDEFGENWT